VIDVTLVCHSNRKKLEFLGRPNSQAQRHFLGMLALFLPFRD